MTKLFASIGGVLLIGTTVVILFTALFSGQMASYSGGVCMPVTATRVMGTTPTTTLSSTEGVSCYPASGNGGTVSMAALSIAAHLYGNPDTWYDTGMPSTGAALLGECLSRWFRLLDRLAGGKPAMRLAGDRSLCARRFPFTGGRQRHRFLVAVPKPAGLA